MNTFTIDPRLFLVFSKDEIDTLVAKANRLDDNEGKVIDLRKNGFIYPIALTSKEIMAYPLM